MITTFENIQRHVVSFVGAVVFAAVMVSAAVPVVPVA